MNAPNRTLTPSQLAQLEQAYGKAPADGWRPLAEAYLARGRYMEAMVVAKRGSRAHPADPGPHLVLARVHAAQRKEDKARAAAAEALRLAPEDPEVLALAREHALVSEPSSAAPATAAAAAESAAPAAASGAPAGEPARSSPAESQAAAEVLASPAEADGAARSSWTEELSRRYGEPEPEERSTRRKRAKRGLLRTITLAVALGVALAGAASVASSRRARAEEQQRLLADAKRLLNGDSWTAYRDAQTTCERAAGLGGDAAPAAHGCAAWAAAVRWAEHGEGDPLRTKAQEHLARSGPDAARPRDAVLAAAWLKLHAGDAAGAVDVLRSRSASDPNARVQAALGAALLEAGDAAGARAALLAAQQLAPGSPRIAQQLGDLLRRGGGEGPEQAATLYEIVLQKLAPDHVPSLIGKAQLLVDARDGAGALATAHRVAELGDRVSPRQRARALALESRALSLLGKKEEAEAALRDARALDADAPELRQPVAHMQR